ncbi:Sodium/hydrogen exchanger family-domain-containing protein [Trichophaea hybrida]|nr:Sodium/hydrogen exchanger family-domain-containing protein [Trichophaea hybrida]
MAWDQLTINRPHLAYTILGGFTSVFMLCSLFIKEKLYIGEATVATICGIIFGPNGAGLFITLEFSRIVLVVQCFAVGVELPKKYMTRHWKSVVFLLVPVMTLDGLLRRWLESLTCAACVTATDPVLASSVVGKGKFARRIPKHLRDLLSAESGCNDGMAFPFIYLSLYLIKYRPNATEVFEHWFCLTVLYECLFGAIYGVCVGYVGRHAIKFAERKNLIDRESFLVFYFVLALWCAGTGSMLGLDDLLVGFCAGVAFSNDGWFSQKTEESHVSNVIDLLLNLAFFVYFGSIIPWASYNRPDWSITPWRLVVIALFVVLFRRIPIMVALKPIIPDIKTWREALFAGHFGPIGVGAIFVAILARAELETGATTPLAVLPPPGHENYIIIELIWPITTFLVLASIIVHGSSIAVFTLGKHINTMRITMSYTTANEEPNWLLRLPRLTPKASMSIRKPDPDESSDEKFAYPPGTLPPPGGIPGGFALNRQPADDDTPLPSRPASIRTRRRKNWEFGHGPGGPISDSAIAPRRTWSEPLDSLAIAQDVTEDQAMDEKRTISVEDQGDMIKKMKTPEGETQNEPHIGPLRIHIPHPHEYTGETSHDVTDEKSALAAAKAETQSKHRTRRPAWAYRFDDNIVVEDEDGEVIRRYKLPKEKKPIDEGRRSSVPTWTQKMLSPFRAVAGPSNAAAEDAEDDNSDAKTVYSMHDAPTNFRMHDEKGRRLSKAQFLQKLQMMDPHARATMASLSTDVSQDDLVARLRQQTGAKDNSALPARPRVFTPQDSRPPSFTLTPSLRMQPPPPPARPVGGDERDVETAAERRRREAALGIGLGGTESDSDDEGGEGRLEAGVGRRRRRTGIRFEDEHAGVVTATSPMAESSSLAGGNGGGGGGGEGGIQWGEDVKGKGRE